ncbi:MAG TPA: hypothetical protein VJV75_03375 [Candidatus Polarisedimenticolia bacterium]|nr:hypothetical protein [Candidatus Polarisedimenticolia bacterium]
MSRGSLDRHTARPARRAALLLAVLLTAACGGGGGGGDEALPCTPLTFDRALSSLSNGDVYLDQASGTCSSVGIAVLINNLQNIWSVGFDLSYPSSSLSYDTCTLGPLLQKGSPSTPIQVLVMEGSGELHVLVTRFAPDPSVNAAGSEALVTCRFQRVAAGSGIIDFDVSPSSLGSEVVLDELGGTRPATFAPGHGGLVTVP